MSNAQSFIHYIQLGWISLSLDKRLHARDLNTLFARLILQYIQNLLSPLGSLAKYADSCKGLV